MFSSLAAATRREGFPTREELIARYEERSGRSMDALNWYQALALWKAAVFMEGNYKRFLAGSTDDAYLGLFDEGVPALAEKAHEVRSLLRHVKGLLVDFGGVLTTNVFESLPGVLQQGGARARRVRGPVPRRGRRAPTCAAVETGKIDEEEFGDRVAARLGVADAEDIVNRLFAGMRPDDPMVEAVRRAQGRRRAHRPGVELDRRRPLRPLAVPGAVRRRRDLRRGGHAQAAARDLPARRRADRRAAGGVRVRGRPARELRRAPRRWA